MCKKAQNTQPNVVRFETINCGTVVLLGFHWDVTPAWGSEYSPLGFGDNQKEPSCIVSTTG